MTNKKSKCNSDSNSKCKCNSKCKNNYFYVDVGFSSRRLISPTMTT